MHAFSNLWEEDTSFLVDWLASLSTARAQEEGMGQPHSKHNDYGCEKVSSQRKSEDIGEDAMQAKPQTPTASFRASTRAAGSQEPAYSLPFQNLYFLTYSFPWYAFYRS